MLKFTILFLAEFLFGSLMFSYWIGKISGKDITKVGDGNPGAYNLIYSTGFLTGFTGLFLDYLKGFIPLYFLIINSKELGLSSIEIGIISFAPVLGHAFSPFLKFKGGKALAVTFGVWSALTKWEVPSLMGGVFTFFLIFKPKNIERKKWLSLAPLAGFTSLSLYLLLKNADVALWVVWFLNSCVVLSKFYFPALNAKIRTS